MRIPAACPVKLKENFVADVVFAKTIYFVTAATN
jgi:hypothetical protein